MHFAKSAIALLAAASSALALTINSPNPTAYWVQNTSNIITWAFNSGDPNPANIIVSNSNSSFLNGNFSIAQLVDLSNGSFIVSNVTLVVASGYTVSFVNASNEEQVYATSQQFEVRTPGTTPASVVSSSAASATATSASNTASGSGTTSGSASTSTQSSAALRALGGEFPALPVIMSAGMVLAGGLLAL